MAYLDSAGNVSDQTVQNWVYFHRVQQVVAKAVTSAPRRYRFSNIRKSSCPSSST